MWRSAWLVMLGCVALTWALCARAEEKKETKGTKVEIDGLSSVTPAEWKSEEIPKKLKKFRVGQFRLPKVGDDKEDAEIVIFYFQGGGGSIKANVERWKTLISPPKGKSIDDVTKIEKMKAGDVPFTWVEIYGTYKGPTFARAEAHKDYRMIKVYFESKNGPYIFSLIGPEKTVVKYKKGFLTWLKGFKSS